MKFVLVILFASMGDIYYFTDPSFDTKEECVTFLRANSQEIEYYEKELHKIQERLGYLYKEKTLTETILAIIQTEKVVDIKEYMQAKLEKKE